MYGQIYFWPNLEYDVETKTAFAVRLNMADLNDFLRTNLIPPDYMLSGSETLNLLMGTKLPVYWRGGISFVEIRNSAQIIVGFIADKSRAAKIKISFGSDWVAQSP